MALLILPGTLTGAWGEVSAMIVVIDPLPSLSLKLKWEGPLSVRGVCEAEPVREGAGGAPCPPWSPH